MRDSDVLARIAGDEFALLLHHCPVRAAERIADDLHKALKNFRFIWQDKSFAVDILALVPASPAFDGRIRRIAERFSDGLLDQSRALPAVER